MTEQGSLKLENDWSELERLNDWVDRFSRGGGFSEGDVYTLRLALEEVVTNIMKYAYGPGVDLPIIITYHRTDEGLTIRIVDEGPAFDPVAAPPPRFDLSIEKMRVGGLGIHLAKKMLDDMSYLRQGEKNILTLVIKNKTGTKNKAGCEGETNG